MAAVRGAIWLTLLLTLLCRQSRDRILLRNMMLEDKRSGQGASFKVPGLGIHRTYDGAGEDKT